MTDDAPDNPQEARSERKKLRKARKGRGRERKQVQELARILAGERTRKEPKLPEWQARRNARARNKNLS
jgi:hypothetical protein